MKKLKIALEYKAFPIGVYDENGTFLDNDSPKLLLKDMKLDDKLVNLQTTYDALFIDNSIEFEYKGFKSQNEKSKFEEDIREIIEIIAKNVKGKYKVENKIDMKKL